MDDYQCCINCSEYQDTGDLDYLENVDISYLQYIMTDTDYDDMFTKVCDYAHLDLAKQMISYAPDNNTTKRYMLEKMCQIGNTDLVNYTNSEWGNCYWRSASRLQRACMSGNLELVQSLHYKHAGVECMENACVNGHLHIVEWLLLSWERLPEISQSCFLHPCGNGHLNMAKFMKQKWEYLDWATDKWNGFIEACQRGHLAMAKWISSNADINDKKFAHACNYAFVRSCINDNLDVINWLYTTSDSKIHHMKNLANVCRSGLLKI
jgi:hypothetical protein